MEYVEVQGASIPKIGLGTWMLGGESCREIVEKALVLGYRLFDTAQSYDNESKVGAGILAGLGQLGIDRDELWVTTKLSQDNLSRARVEPSVHDSLRRLGLEYVDELLIHWPSTEVPLRETLEAMTDLVEKGYVRHVGVSNFTPPLLEEALQIAPILSNQVELHPFLAQDRLLAIAERHELALAAYSPLARGRVARDPVLAEIARARGKTAPQVALRWLTQHANVYATPKAASEEHLRENLDIFDFELSADEANRVAHLARGERLIDPEWAPDWDR
jgi:2,5-diketo-D-gluconate reductase B